MAKCVFDLGEDITTTHSAVIQRAHIWCESRLAPTLMLWVGLSPVRA
jgi:hypothetical protein